MKASYLASLAIVAASLAVAVPASAHVNDAADIAVDQSVASTGGLTISAIETGNAASNTTGFTKTAAAARHGQANKLSLNPRRPCADPKAFGPGC